jgi:UDP-N-acetylmuramate--alanine ligase
VGIKNKIISQTLSSFKGISRRLEKIGETKGVVVYDDYAHHPTAIKETLTAVSQRHPGARIWAVVEPHTFSRTKALLSLYQNVFVLAAKVIIAPIFRSRDTSDLGISGESIVKVARHPSIKYIDNFDEIVKEVTTGVAKGDVVVVMGAGASYKLARDIYENI